MCNSLPAPFRPFPILRLNSRKAIPRGSSAPSELHIDSRLVPILAEYVVESSDQIGALVAKFFATLLSESALLDQHELDQFILANSDTLTQWYVVFFILCYSEVTVSSFLVPGISII